jgi:hypothetical protein
VLRLKAKAPAGGQRYDSEDKRAGRDAGGTEGTCSFLLAEDFGVGFAVGVEAGFFVAGPGGF